MRPSHNLMPMKLRVMVEAGFINLVRPHFFVPFSNHAPLLGEVQFGALKFWRHFLIPDK